MLIGSVLSLIAVKLWCRLMPPRSMADVRELAEKAPIVFRGRVAQVRVAEHFRHALDSRLATIDVDRLYRGSLPENPTIHFEYGGSPSGMMGHDCIDFQPDTYWLVFAVEKGGQLELFDDCEGALAISPLLGPHLKDFDWRAQMEADFLAGLNDVAAANRIVSIQRLGGLKLPSSLNALHRVIARGDKNEANWAVCSSLRIGDLSVLPRVKQILPGGDMSSPERQIAGQLEM